MSLSVNVYHKDEAGRMTGPLKPYPWKGKRPSDDPEFTARFKAMSLEQQLDLMLGPRSERGKDLAGPEAWRTEVWGSSLAHSLGLTLLPSLAKRDIWATGDALDHLDREVSILFEHLDQLAQTAGRPSKDMASYLTNMKNAVIKAKEINGGVVIW